MTEDKKIIIDSVTKIYNMYTSPTDRLKEVFFPGKIRHTEFYALKNVCFDIYKGEIVGIMGRNGAGKSTLLKIITGVLQPSNGSVTVSGRISSLLELGAGFNMEYTGIENIYFYGTIMGLSKAEVDAKVDDIISFAEVGDFIHQPVKSYSSGMFARLAFSCAINVEPDVLIVDEILSVGDMRFQAKCFKKFKEFKQKGVTILYVGHDIATMRSFCDRCIWMHKGEIVTVGDPVYISAKYIEFMYAGDENLDIDALLRKNISEVEIDEPEKKSSPNGALEENKDRRCVKRNEPIAHWGSRMGLIRNVSMKCNEKSVVQCGPRDNVTISFAIPYIEDIDYDTLSVSFSIKNKDGTDLIVKTTYESDIRLKDSAKKGLIFSFNLQLQLANGDYYLAIAVEDRSNAVNEYYEYIEGAIYFKVYEDRRQYCMFLPEIDVEIK